MIGFAPSAWGRRGEGGHWPHPSHALLMLLLLFLDGGGNTEASTPNVVKGLVL